ncbi:MAG: GTP 3',8-cyclase MoaA [Verrucomicrobiaceae bacterium]|nr:GTP 3',8-cyclase MoaA [Verrucomicrobiaceae bacterium]
MQDKHGHRISYLRISITDRCNERCGYCMPAELQEWLPREGVLTYEEILRIADVAAGIGITKVRVTGGEPLTRRDVIPFLERLCSLKGISEVGVSTNGTLLSKAAPGFITTADALVAAGVRSVNISLDTLDPSAYAVTTGRDYFDRVISGIDAARQAGFERIKINAVLMRGRSEEQLLPLVDFAHDNGLLLRFIELMPVSSGDVLSESSFLPVAEARRCIEENLGALDPRADFRTNGPASYFSVPGRDQLLGFIGAMTNLHFCETCNKLRLTCDGKLRPCLGSHLEFDLMKEIRSGASDQGIIDFIEQVVERKPMEHDFRNHYFPGRKMIAIGG